MVKRSQRHRFIVRIEKPVELCAADVHAFAQLGLGEALLFHKSVKLARDNALDRSRSNLFVDEAY